MALGRIRILIFPSRPLFTNELRCDVHPDYTAEREERQVEIRQGKLGADEEKERKAFENHPKSLQGEALVRFI